MSKIIPVILCGGAGSRLAPLSRPEFPKQFLRFTHKDKSLFQQALSRANNISSSGNTVIVSNYKYESLIKSQMDSENLSNLILEPIAKNTAISIALTALYVEKTWGSHTLCIFPADHFIEDESALTNAIRMSENITEDGYIVTFGIKPKFPSDQFGYIRAESTNSYITKALRFIEKPNQNLATQLIASKNWLWNSGIFLFNSRVIIQEMQQLIPNVFHMVNNAFKAGKYHKQHEINKFTPEPKAFNQIIPTQIDKTVLQKSDKLMVKPLDIQWHDIGTPQALRQYLEIKNAE